MLSSLHRSPFTALPPADSAPTPESRYRLVKPRIGITAGLLDDTWAESGAQWKPYADSILRAGGIPVRVDRSALGRELRVLQGLQGLVFTGGKDIHLELYPNPPELNGAEVDEVMRRHSMALEPERDEYELALLQRALERDIPILGICRGCQLLHVGLGGRLVLDIPTELGERVPHRAPPPATQGASHPVTILPGTILARALPPESFSLCNSRHHQAVRLEEGMLATVAAVSPEDGLVEAIELHERKWVVGVQWHPEHPTDEGIEEKYRPLFRAFIEAAS
jgi:putative glutamine amidotransferase